MIAVGIYMIAVVFMAMMRKRAGARLQFFGILFFVLAIVHDIFFNLFYISSWFQGAESVQLLKNQIVLLGLFVLVFVQAIVLAQRYSNAFHTVEQLSDKLLSQARLKDEFLINTSHELKTPLHGIINLLHSMVESPAGTVNKEQKETLSAVISVARRLTNLVNDILDFSKLKNNELILNPESVSLQAVLRANLEVFQHYTSDKQIDLRMRIPDDLSHVYVDENRLLQILYNLIGNAIKFTEEGSITISAARQGNQIEVRVSDTGIGIPEDKLDLIFQSFEQMGTAVAREYGGTGIGLSITKRLVELSGGTLTVSSEEGKGSVFTFTLPTALDKTDQSPAATKSPYTPYVDVRRTKQTSAAPESKYTILAVDDEAANLQVIHHVLAQEPYQILQAYDGEEAMRFIDKEQKVDLVILDVMMPRMSGYEVTAKIRERFSLSELPILLVTVKNEPEDLLSGFSAGANDFLVKPFYAHELRARVRTLLELKHSVDELIRSEMDFLRAQIKPHFLYNALNTIVGICPRDPKKAGFLLTELSHFLRGSFDFPNKEKVVPVHKELELVHSYVFIEKARFEQRLQVIYDIDQQVNIMLPPLSIQPLVENAIRHGVTKQIGGGTVRIRIQSEDEYISISVEDDGVGIPSEQLETLLEESYVRRGVGLRNIHQRLRRMYGYGLEVRSSVGEGTTVSMKIPNERGGSLDESLVG
jgi:signal transduction histidine kinase